jgi:hypothetical protein
MPERSASIGPADKARILGCFRASARAFAHCPRRHPASRDGQLPGANREAPLSSCTGSCPRRCSCDRRSRTSRLRTETSGAGWAGRFVLASRDLQLPARRASKRSRSAGTFTWRHGPTGFLDHLRLANARHGRAVRRRIALREAWNGRCLHSTTCTPRLPFACSRSFSPSFSPPRLLPAAARTSPSSRIPKARERRQKLRRLT